MAHTVLSLNSEDRKQLIRWVGLCGEQAKLWEMQFMWYWYDDEVKGKRERGRV